MSQVGMVRNTVHACMVLLLLQWATLANSAESADYDYIPGSPNGPDHWGELDPAWRVCNAGRRQSPIALTSMTATINESLGSLNYSYKPTEGVFGNRGHDVEVSFASSAGTLVIEKDVYELTQLHFHTPSEHTVESRQFPLDMHLVHSTADGSKLAVISILFFVGEHNKFLDQYWHLLANITETGAEVHINGKVSLEELDFGQTYARYPGSLTTAPCTENVIWTVPLSKRNSISECQLEKLKDVLKEPNARPLQNLNGRKVFLSTIRKPHHS